MNKAAYTPAQHVAGNKLLVARNMLPVISAILLTATSNMLRATNCCAQHVAAQHIALV